MKIAIVCGHFIPTMGYIEVHLANAFHRIGHEVTVITSNKSSSTASYSNLKEQFEKPKYNIIRLKPWFAKGQIVIAKGLKKEIQELDPDKVIVLALGKVFPKEVFKISSRKFELISLIGENETNHYRSEKNIRRVLMQTLLKTPVFELAIQKSDKLVGYTPSGKDTVSAFIKKELKTVLDQKYSTMSLGFDENEFNLDNTQRTKVRKELGIQDDETVVVTATRITSAKKFETIIDAMATLSRKGLKFKYVLIGFSNDKYCQELKKYIADRQLEDVVITLPFIARNEMNDYYNMADIGLWTRAAISMFEGLATGLFVLLPKQKNVSHILSGNRGIYFNQEDLLNHLEESIVKYDSETRPEIAKVAKSNFSFDTLAHNLIQN